MIQIRCANCEGIFQASDEAEGTVERCPDCGAINDVPLNDTDLRPDDEVPFSVSVSETSRRKRPRGMPSPIFWLISVTLIAGFIVALIFVLSPDWETQHLPEVGVLVASGDSAVSQRNFETAITKYQTAINLAENHAIQSRYFQRLLQHATQSMADAKNALDQEMKNASSRPESH